MRVAAFGGDADRPVQRARGHDVEGVVARAGHVERVDVGRAVDERHAAHGDGAGAFHEARAAQVEHGVFTRAPAVQAGQRGHDLQFDGRARTEGLCAVDVGVVDEALAQPAHTVHADVDQVRARARVAAVPGVQHQQVEAQGVGLPSRQAGEVEFLAGVVAEAPAEAAEGGHGVGVDRGVAPRRVGHAAFEVVREDGAGTLHDANVVQAPAFVGQAFQPAVAEVDDAARAGGREAHADVAVNGVGVAAEAQVARALVDHAQVARGGRVGHHHLQPRACGVDDQRGLRDDPGVARVVPRVEQHPCARTEVGAGELDHLPDVGRRQGRVGRHTRCRAGQHLAQRGRGHRHRVQAQINPVDLPLGGRGPQAAIRREGQPGDLVLVEPLAACVHPAQLGEHARGPDAVLHHLGPAVGRAQPQVPVRRVDRQPRPALDVERRRDFRKLGPRGRTQLHDGVAVLRTQVQVPVARAVRPGREVVVAVQRQARNHRLRARVHRHHPVCVGVAAEDQQAARGHRRAPQRHARREDLQPQVAVAVGHAEAGVGQREAVQHLATGFVDLEQVPWVGVVAHPQVAAGVHRHVPKVAPGHVGAHGVERKRRTRAPGRGDAHVAQPVCGQGGAVEVGRTVLLDAVVVNVDVVALRSVVHRAGACKVVAAGPFHITRAEEHGAVLDVDAGDGGHDLQQRLAAGAEHLQRVRTVGRDGQHERGAGAVSSRRARAEPGHLQRAVDVAPAQQHVGAGVQARTGQVDGLPRVGRALPSIGRCAAERHAGDAAQADAVVRAGAPRRLDVDRPEHAVGDRHAHPRVPVADVAPQGRVVPVEHVRPSARACVQHRAVPKPVFARVAFRKPAAQDQHLRAAPVPRHRLHLNVHNRGQNLEQEGAVGEVGARAAHLRIDHCVAGGGVARHVEVGDATVRVDPVNIDRHAASGAVAVDGLEGGLGGGRVERHRNADLLVRVGRRCGQRIGDAAECPHITGRTDREVTHDVTAQRIADPVGDHGFADAQLIVAGRQVPVGDHRQALTEGPRIQLEGRDQVVARSEDAVRAGTGQRHPGSGEQGGVDRLVESNVDRAHDKPAITLPHAGRNNLRREGVGHHVQRDHV